MDLLQAILLGLVEGATEFLPISSTAHLMLGSRLLGLDGEDSFLKTFEVAIQSGAILAVVGLYARRLWADWAAMLRVLVAFLPTVVIGLLVHKWVRTLLGSTEVALLMLAVGGALLLLFERLHRERTDGPETVAGLSWIQALLIGCCQTLAFVPGVSRAAATIVGGMALGLSRRTAVEFSFLLAVPTVAAASAKELHDHPAALEGGHLSLLLAGAATAFVAALLAIRLLLGYVRRHDMQVFGWYRIALAAVLWFVWRGFG